MFLFSLAAGPDYSRFDIFFTTTISNVLNVKCDINQQFLFEKFHSLEVVDRVSETQLQVGKSNN